MKLDIIFEKETNGNWYVVLPDWKGSKSDLQMVAGADTMLDILAKNKNSVKLHFELTPYEGSNCIELVELLQEGFGADYILKKYNGKDLNLEMWLCDVTKFVFGYFPVGIYFNKIE